MKPAVHLMRMSRCSCYPCVHCAAVHRYQTMHPCSNAAGTCLANQPYHLITEDSDRASNGLEPLHLAQRYSQVGTVRLDRNLNASTVHLEYSVPSISSSMLKVEVAADSLNFITRSPPGEVRHHHYHSICGVVIMQVVRKSMYCYINLCSEPWESDCCLTLGTMN